MYKTKNLFNRELCFIISAHNLLFNFVPHRQGRYIPSFKIVKIVKSLSSIVLSRNNNYNSNGRVDDKNNVNNSNDNKLQHVRKAYILTLCIRWGLCLQDRNSYRLYKVRLGVLQKLKGNILPPKVIRKYQTPSVQ